MAVDEKTWMPVLGNVTGGLSGPAIKPVALKIVWEVSRKVHIPIIASGGAVSWQDVVQFLLVGASAVEIGSASLRAPWCFVSIIRGLEEYLENQGLSSFYDIIGKLKHLSVPGNDRDLTRSRPREQHQTLMKLVCHLFGECYMLLNHAGREAPAVVVLTAMCAGILGFTGNYVMMSFCLLFLAMLSSFPLLGHVVLGVFIGCAAAFCAPDPLDIPEGEHFIQAR
jgi:hypothetical protein